MSIYVLSLQVIYAVLWNRFIWDKTQKKNDHKTAYSTKQKNINNSFGYSRANLIFSFIVDTLFLLQSFLDFYPNVLLCPALLLSILYLPVFPLLLSLLNLCLNTRAHAAWNDYIFYPIENFYISCSLSNKTPLYC